MGSRGVANLELLVCRVEYRLVRKLGEGTFSEVLKAESVKTRQKVAIKCMKSHFDNIEKVSGLVSQSRYTDYSISVGAKSARDQGLAAAVPAQPHYSADRGALR